MTPTQPSILKEVCNIRLHRRLSLVYLWQERVYSLFLIRCFYFLFSKWLERQLSVNRLASERLPALTTNHPEPGRDQDRSPSDRSDVSLGRHATKKKERLWFVFESSASGGLFNDYYHKKLVRWLWVNWTGWHIQWRHYFLTVLMACQDHVCRKNNATARFSL